MKLIENYNASKLTRLGRGEVVYGDIGSLRGTRKQLSVLLSLSLSLSDESEQDFFLIFDKTFDTPDKSSNFPL